jgi:hypothetical protein
MKYANNPHGSSGDGLGEYDPSAGMALPGSGGRQRLNQSGRPTVHNGNCKEDFKKCEYACYDAHDKQSRDCVTPPGHNPEACGNALWECQGDVGAYFLEYTEEMWAKFNACYKTKCGKEMTKKEAECVENAWDELRECKDTCKQKSSICCLIS